MSCSWVMRQDGDARSMFQALEDVHHLDTRAAVEVAGRFVGQEDGRVVDERPARWRRAAAAAESWFG